MYTYSNAPTSYDYAPGAVCVMCRTVWYNGHDCGTGAYPSRLRGVVTTSTASTLSWGDRDPYAAQQDHADEPPRVHPRMEQWLALPRNQRERRRPAVLPRRSPTGMGCRNFRRDV